MTSEPSLLELTSTIVTAYLRNNHIAVADISGVIRNVHGVLAGISAGSVAAQVVTSQKPAVPVKKSITPDYIVCLEDGKKLKMLKRYIRSRFRLSPDEYRTKWGLPADYPMVAPNYSERRSDFAKQIGLGKKTASKTIKRRKK